MGVPFIDLQSQQAEIAADVEPAVLDILRRGAFVGGPAVAAFEQEYAAYLGVAHCVGVANGTDAVELALRAVGVTAGGEVIMPANTFIATAEALAVLVSLQDPNFMAGREAARDSLAGERGNERDPGTSTDAASISPRPSDSS